MGTGIEPDAVNLALLGLRLILGAVKMCIRDRRTMTRVRYPASSPGVAVQAPSSGVSTASKRVAVPATRNSSWT